VTDRKLKDTPRAADIESLLHEHAKRLSLNGVTEIAGAGAVLNGILVLENGPACMLKLPKKESGGGSIWDFAATACIYQEFGLPVTNFDGGRLDLNRNDGTFMNHSGFFLSAHKIVAEAASSSPTVALHSNFQIPLFSPIILASSFN
jgi:3'-phosphoadenosine 5'-phosphosulfate (PAPS) 3'-phosphatase